MQNERIWLQTYVSKLETRVNELERTNRILKQMCELLPNPANDSYSQHDNNGQFHLPSPPKSYIENTMKKMHEKVSHFLVQQMDKQIDKMFETMNEQSSYLESQIPMTTNTQTTMSQDEIIDSTESQQTESSVTIVNVPTNKGISKDPKYYHGTPLIYKQRPASPHSSFQQKEIIGQINGVKTTTSKSSL